MGKDRVVVVAWVITGMCFSGTAFSQSEVPCDRECLTGLVDQYLRAVVAHDPSRASLARNVKFTENGQALKPGEGLWATASDDATYRVYFADPAAEQVGFMGVIRENGAPVIVALRMKADNRQLTQVESLVARNDPGGMGRPEALVTPRPLLLEQLSPGDRSPREKLLGIVNSYFDGLDEMDSAKNIPFDKDCQKVENGIETANAIEPNADPLRRMGCAAQLNTGFTKIVTGVRERRYLICDEERGLVYSVAFIDHAGILKTVKLNDGATMAVPQTHQRPLTHMAGTLFKIKGGKIRHIEAVVVPVPYGMKSGWYSSNRQ